MKDCSDITATIDGIDNGVLHSSDISGNGQWATVTEIFNEKCSAMSKRDADCKLPQKHFRNEKSIENDVGVDGGRTQIQLRRSSLFTLSEVGASEWYSPVYGFDYISVLLLLFDGDGGGRLKAISRKLFNYIMPYPHPHQDQTGATTKNNDRPFGGEGETHSIKPFVVKFIYFVI